MNEASQAYKEGDRSSLREKILGAEWTGSAQLTGHEVVQ